MLEGIGESFEIIFVNDGSFDASGAILKDFAASDARIKVVTFSRNFGHQPAVTCGMDRACGDAVICMDGDLQDPPEVLPDLVQRWREGYHVVYAVRQDRKRTSSARRL